MKKALPIGIENFEEMVTGNYYYVDKSLLLKEFLDLRGKVNLFTRPAVSENIEPEYALVLF